MKYYITTYEGKTRRCSDAQTRKLARLLGFKVEEFKGDRETWENFPEFSSTRIKMIEAYRRRQARENHHNK